MLSENMSDLDTLEATVTPQQKLAHVAEECAEFLQAYAKYQRFGMWPYFRGAAYNNMTDMLNEMEDIILAVKRFKNYVASTTPNQRQLDFGK